VVGGMFLLFTALSTAVAYSIAASGSGAITSALNDFGWAALVVSCFPRAMLIMAGSFGLWRAGRISNRTFGAGVTLVILTLLGATTWMSDGVWAPDGVYSRFVVPALGLVWVLVFNRVVQTSPATRAAW